MKSDSKYNTYARSAPKVEENDENSSDFIKRINKILNDSKKAREFKQVYSADKGKVQNPDSAEFVMQEPPAQEEPPLPSEPLYDFDWRGTPLPASIYGVAKLTGKGVVVNGKLEGNVYMSLHQVTCDQALNYLANAFGINWMTDGNNIVVSTGELMKQSQTFKVNYANKENLAKEFKAIGIPEENIFANPQTGTISVTGTPYQLTEAQKRLKQIDKPVSQCLILAQLIEISHGKDVDLGLSYELPTYSHAADPTSTSGTLNGRFIDKMAFGASLRANEALSKGKVIARPMTLALNGQKGLVNFGDKVPVLTKTDTGSSTSLTVTYEDVGTKLEVTPTINESTGEITLDINTEVSNITQWITQNDTRAPQISTRTATTSAHIKSGQSFVIGGLMSKVELDNLSGIPGLMHLPILGKLFSVHTKSKDFTEVYIMITPFIMSDVDNVNVRDIYDELHYIDGKAKKDDVIVPGHDWSNDIGKHRENHEKEVKR